MAAEMTDLAAGTAGEHIVCADLLLSGFKAFLADQLCPYDVALDVGGVILRVQVKSTRLPRAIPQRVNHHAAYMWHVKRAGKKGRRQYSGGEFDLLALVALDCRKVAYCHAGQIRQTIHIRTGDSNLPPKHGGKFGLTFAQLSINRALRELAVGTNWRGLLNVT